MKRPTNFPDTFLFNKLGPYGERCFYEYVEFRAPRAGEYYVSSALTEAWKAICDGYTKYHIVKPTYRAIRRNVYSRGERVG